MSLKTALKNYDNPNNINTVKGRLIYVLIRLIILAPALIIINLLLN